MLKKLNINIKTGFYHAQFTTVILKSDLNVYVMLILQMIKFLYLVSVFFTQWICVKSCSNT